MSWMTPKKPASSNLGSPARNPASALTAAYLHLCSVRASRCVPSTTLSDDPQIPVPWTAHAQNPTLISSKARQAKCGQICRRHVPRVEATRSACLSAGRAGGSPGLWSLFVNSRTSFSPNNVSGQGE